jgi:excisionase family DNA binding protein
MDKLLLTPEEAAEVLGISRSKLYELLRRGDLPSVRIDGSRRVATSVLRAYVDSLLPQALSTRALPSER